MPVSRKIEADKKIPSLLSALIKSRLSLVSPLFHPARVRPKNLRTKQAQTLYHLGVEMI